MTLSLAHVTLTYPDGSGRLTALDDVSLDVAPGEFTVVVGPSGSGKSSLLAVAATLTAPDSGTVTVAGKPTHGLSRRDLAALRRDRIGIVFQQPNLLPALTTVEQLVAMGHLGGRRDGVPQSEALDLLDAVGLADLAARRPSELSGGQRQRVNIARALVNHPGVLLVDEPTSALDHERGAAIMELLRDITRDRETATVLVTHDVAHLSADDRVLTCHDGVVSESRRLQSAG